MKDLAAYLKQITRFSEAELLLLQNLFSVQKYNKKAYFATDGEYSSKMGFLRSGVLRAFYRNNQGEEYNKTFFTPPCFLGAYSSLVSGAQNQINIQCLTDCQILEANYRDFTHLFDAHPKAERFARILAEQFFRSKEKKEIELVMMDATQRYRIFQEEHPGLENQIPQYHIASYLGITPTQLSRIRAKR